jgi:hypothetical protein
MSRTIRVYKTAFRSFSTAKYARRSNEKVDVIKFGTFGGFISFNLMIFFDYIIDVILKEVF